MNELDYGAAAMLGFVQGATEFLPISSSAHLAIVQQWLGLLPNSPAVLLFDGLTHIGTVMSILIVFARSLGKYAARLWMELNPTWSRRRDAWRIAFLGVAASVPTAIIGLAFRNSFQAAFADSVRVGVGLLITAMLLYATVFIPRGRRGWRQFPWWHAVIVGVAQGIAIEPGISRSGSTICAASFLGLRRRWAAQFSFFIAMPAILGATAIQFRDTLEQLRVTAGTPPWAPLLLGSLVSLVVGVFALRWLLAAVRRAKLHYFAGYCLLLGLLLCARWI